MDSDTVSGLFQPFARARNTARGTEGTGLGLLMCKRLVEVAQGDIQVDSTPGQGTRVTISLPSTDPVENGGDTAGATPAPAP
jgi:signal transduction histidine kinase